MGRDCASQYHFYQSFPRARPAAVLFEPWSVLFPDVFKIRFELLMTRIRLCQILHRHN